MARITVEDCTDKITNRFELVLLACHRSRQISKQSPITVERDNDKNPIIALREIAEETISLEDVKEDLIHSMQNFVEVDESEPEEVPLLEANTRAPILDQDNRSQDTVIDRMTEDELRRGLESLGSPDTSYDRSHSR